jgi:hypothetical protein
LPVFLGFGLGGGLRASQSRGGCLEIVDSEDVAQVLVQLEYACGVVGTGLGDQAMRRTGPPPAADHERQYRDSHSLHTGLLRARYLDTGLSWTRSRLIAYAKRCLGL